MITSRRRAHRILIAALGPIAIVVLLAAVGSRVPRPTVDALPGFARGPGEVAPATGEDAAVLWSREDLFGAWPARVTARADGTIELKPLRPIARPDVLLYWVAPGENAGTTADASGEGGTTSGLDADAHLLGRIGGTRLRRFPLPAHGEAHPARESLGSLVLYSLGHQTVFARARLPGGSGTDRQMDRLMSPSGAKR